MRRLTTEIFIERAKKIHGSKFNYDDVHYVNARTKVLIYCNECETVFYQKPASHLRGIGGCPECAKRNRAFSQRITKEAFVDKALAVHKGKYLYDSVNYVNDSTKVLIYCVSCGEYFWQTPNAHLRGQGCPKCGRASSIEKHTWSLVDFVNRAKEKHGEKYDYGKVQYKNCDEKICIVCPKHGEFWQTPYSHLNSSGCIKCAYEDISRRADEIGLKISETKRRNGTFNISMIQVLLYNKLILYFGRRDVFYEYELDKRYPFHCDFYIKSKDLFIELNGFWTHNDHWFDENNSKDLAQLTDWSMKSQKSDFYKNAIETWTKRDVIKREYARRNNLNYVVFWGNCQNDIDAWFEVGCPIRKDWK